MPTTKNSFLFAVSSIYLRDFGISPSEASDEVATVNLAHQAEEYRATGRRAVSAAVLRNRLVRFLRDHSSVCNFGGSTNCELGFSISYRHDGTKGRWCVGPLGADGPAFVETR
jgi:hypothetical protein